jgi:hypothetical protein
MARRAACWSLLALVACSLVASPAAALDAAVLAREHAWARAACTPANALPPDCEAQAWATPPVGPYGAEAEVATGGVLRWEARIVESGTDRGAPTP